MNNLRTTRRRALPKRTNFIVLCRNHTPSCSCCRGCRRLHLPYVRYQDSEGYHFKAPRSISKVAAEKLLNDQGVTNFRLVPCRARVSLREIELLARRPAYFDQDLEEEDEEELIKFLEIAIGEGKKVASLDLEVKNLKEEFREMKEAQAEIVRRQDIKNEELSQKQHSLGENLTTLLQLSTLHESKIQQLTQHVDQLSNSQLSTLEQLSQNIAQSIENGFRQLCFTSNIQNTTQPVDRKQQGQARLLDTVSTSGLSSSSHVNSGQSRGQFFTGHEDSSR